MVGGLEPPVMGIWKQLLLLIWDMVHEITASATEHTDVISWPYREGICERNDDLYKNVIEVETKGFQHFHKTKSAN